MQIRSNYSGETSLPKVRESIQNSNNIEIVCRYGKLQFWIYAGNFFGGNRPLRTSGTANRWRIVILQAVRTGIDFRVYVPDSEFGQQKVQTNSKSINLCGHFRKTTLGLEHITLSLDVCTVRQNCTGSFLQPHWKEKQWKCCWNQNLRIYLPSWTKLSWPTYDKHSHYPWETHEKRRSTPIFGI